MRGASFKPDASFFRKIAMGAVGARAVCTDLGERGHQVVELERGSTDTKLWKEVKRKRFRIPDLVCVHCGKRIECRAKAHPQLAMSHSTQDAQRSWDHGLVPDDWVAFPVCTVPQEEYWSRGRLRGGASYWQERHWIEWQRVGHINYIEVASFRNAAADQTATKGPEEASETVISWNARFATKTALVERVWVEGEAQKVTLKPLDGSRRSPCKVPEGWFTSVAEGQTVVANQIVASRVPALGNGDLACPGSLPSGYLGRLLGSPQPTELFTGIKLSRLLGDTNHAERIRELAEHSSADLYVRLEGAVYLAALCESPIGPLFGAYLAASDPATSLEAVIALADVQTQDATDVLMDVLADTAQRPYLRSAAAWSLGRVGNDAARQGLIEAFADLDPDLREEAIENIAFVGNAAQEALLEGLTAGSQDVAAGCAESLRQLGSLPKELVGDLVAQLDTGKIGDPGTRWVVWLLAHLPTETVLPAIAPLQQSRPELHYAHSVVSAFVRSWIARRWELRPDPPPPTAAAEVAGAGDD